MASSTTERADPLPVLVVVCGALSLLAVLAMFIVAIDQSYFGYLDEKRGLEIQAEGLRERAFALERQEQWDHEIFALKSEIDRLKRRLGESNGQP